MPHPMTTRRRAAFLRKLGFIKSPFNLTRRSTSYRHPTGGLVSFPTRADGGAPFYIMGTHRRQFDFITSLLGIRNTRAGAAERLRELKREGYAVPSPDAPDAGEPEWIDALFVALAEAIANTPAQEE